MVKKNILIISHDKVGPSMAGPGIRYHQMALNLAKQHSVTLGVFNPTYIENIDKTNYKAIDINIHDFEKEFKKYDIIIALWLNDEMIRFAKKQNIVLIFDLYAPVPVEDLVQRVYGERTDSVSDFDYNQMLNNYSHFINNGDFLLTSNDQQNDFWVGYSFASKKISPSKQLSRSIDSYFGICPMGINLDELSQLSKYPDLLSKRILSIEKDDFVIVWTGGIWDWFDAKTPIEAMKIISKKKQHNIKLVFLGTKHPNDDVPAMQETEIARELAKKSGLIDKQIFFLDGWLPYSDRIHYLKRANIALYAHKPSVEARFSHRTRVLDHILMSLPTVSTEGDYLSDYMNSNKLGISVKPYDSQGLAEAILNFANDKKLLTKYHNNIKKTQYRFTWDYTLRGLKNFIDGDNCKPSPYIERNSNVSAQHHIQDSKIIQRVKGKIPSPIKRTIKRVINR